MTKRYPNGFVAVDDLHIDVPKGSLLGLLGPSGCGKTTTLRMVAGLVPIEEGHLVVDGQELSAAPPHRRDIGLVFQNYALFPHMTVGENVAFGLEMRGVPRSEIRARVDEALEMVRLPGYRDRKPREMSGGQQQRVSLARALVIRPRLLLLDEPLSNLDAKLRDEMRVEIREIQQRLGITSVFVTHDQVEALTMCDVVGVMNKGRLAQLGSPDDIYERPASMFVAEFVGRINKLPCEIVAGDRVRLAGTVCRSAAHDLPEGRGIAAIRPHRIHLTAARDPNLVGNSTNAVKGIVRTVTYIGDIVQYDVEIAEGVLLKIEQHTQGSGLHHNTGDEVLCEWAPRDMLIFGRDDA
ncbi:ABC transporter ATP-binding protein [Paracoccus luteus]|uniref:ABC transporter ATP-binding protein n=1 Tax=Paracoccus luteus TaxID=2508543 RepID=UPI001C6FD607|nr:ABC transporter ATP-binding protein [Paracoccus luteus]